jgi:NLI interacting factor-like phosphatase
MLPIDLYFNDKGAWCKGVYNVVNTTKCALKKLVEHSELRQLAGTRLLLYRLYPVINITAPMISLTDHQQEVLREAVCSSTVIVFSSSIKPPAPEEPVLMAFVEFSADNNAKILIDGYLTSLTAMQAYVDSYQQSVLRPPALAAAVSDDTGKPALRLPYTPETHRIFVLLDLDKTALLSDCDCLVDQRPFFKPDIEIAGTTAVSDGAFKHRMMLRPGMYTFLRRVMKVADVGVVTAGDIYYARAAVGAANDRGWATGSPDDSLPVVADDAPVDAPADPTQLTPIPRGLEGVRIPLTHVFSVRRPKKVLYKTFAGALPFVELLRARGASVPVLAVDDDPTVWDPACRPQVLSISPFQPNNNSPACLLRIAKIIEDTAQNYYTSSVKQL